MKKNMSYTIVERIILVASYLSLSGVLFSGLVAKGILESNHEMCVPQAAATFLLGSFASVVIWAVLTLLLNISRCLRDGPTRQNAVQA